MKRPQGASSGPRNARPAGRIGTRWLMLTVLVLARTAIAFQFQTVASAWPFLESDLAIDSTELGLLIGLYMAPGVVLALPGGLVGERFGAKRIVLVGLALMTAGGLLMAHDALAAVFAGRIISGIGGILLNVMLTKMVADWFADRDIVTATGFFVASWPLGLALGLLTFPSLALWLGYSAIMIAGALASLGSLLLIWLVYRDTPRPRRRGRSSAAIILSRREWMLVSLAGAIWGTFNVAYIVLVSFLPGLFAEYGYSRPEAAALVSVLGWALIPLVPLAGYLAERIRRPDLIMGGGFVVLGAAAAALPHSGAPLVSFAIIVVAFSLPAGLVLSLPATALRAENRASGMGIFYTWFYGLMAVLPAVAGKLVETTGSPATAVLFSASMMVVATTCLIGFRMAAPSGPP